MKQYGNTVEETISQTFSLNATSKEDAFRLATQKYKSGEFVLTPGNLIDVRFNVYDD